jgi:hypothetical protein
MKKNMQVLCKVLSESYPFSDFSNTKTEKQLALSETFFFTSCCCCCCYRDLTERLSDKISQMQNAAASTITLYPPHETQDKNPTKKEKEGKKKKKKKQQPHPKKLSRTWEKKKKSP